LLIVASGLAVTGTSGALVFYASPRTPDGFVMTQLRTGWRWAFMGVDVDSADSVFMQFVTSWLYRDGMMAFPPERIAAAPLVGAPVLLSAVLALIVGVHLLGASGRPPHTGIGAGLAALTGGLLAGGAASIALDVSAEIGDATGPDSIWHTVHIGAGAQLILAASVATLVAVVLTSWGPVIRVSRMRPRRHQTSAALLVLVAALSVGGSIMPLVVGRGVYTGSPLTPTGIATGAENGFDIPIVAPFRTAPPLWIALGAGAALALVAALVLLLRARRSEISARARALGIVSCAVLVGISAHVWIDLLAAMRNAEVLARSGHDVVAAPGAGAWLLLVAAVVALASIGLLLVPVTPTHEAPAPPGAGQATPLPGPTGSGPRAQPRGA
jgi:hypothetical protein